MARDIFGTRVDFADKSYDALKGADALAHRDRVERVPRARLHRIKKLMRTPVIFDGRNLYNPEQLRGAGLHLLVDGPPVSVLVTGGAGYIGSHAVKALRAAGQRRGRSTTI